MIAADSRITWKKASVQVDEVQKVYLPAPEVAIAFAGNDVADIQSALRSFKAKVRERGTPEPDEPLSKFNDWLMRVLRREARSISSQATLLLGALHNSRPNANILKLFHIWDGEIKSEADIAPGDYRIAGSAPEEAHAAALEAKLAGSFQEPELPQIHIDAGIEIGIDMSGAMLATAYSTALETLKRERAQDEPGAEGLDSAGPVLHSVISDSGHFCALCVETEVVFRDGRARFKTRYDSESHAFVQVNCLSEEEQALYSIDHYDFSRAPQSQNRFDVTLR